MKLEARRIEAFLRDPGGTRVVLLHGDDAGLIRHLATRLVHMVAGSINDPFRVAELEPSAIASIATEVASLPMTGGRRVVRLRDAGDSAAAAVQAVLVGAAPGFLVLEASGLGPRSKLRSLVERAPDAVAIGCYRQEGRELARTIEGLLSGYDITVDADALRWLGDQFGADRDMTRIEVEKLALYVGQKGRVDAATARATVGDFAGLSLDDALYSATAGDVGAADRALERAVAEGAAPVSILRAALLHLQKLQRARLAVDGGMTATEAAKAVRPPLFFRREASFVQALGIWSASALGWGCARVWDAERACKRTGAPAEVISRNAIFDLAQQAAQGFTIQG